MNPRRLLAAACVCLVASGCQLPQRFTLKKSVHVGSTRIGIFLLPTEFYALHPQLESLFDAPVLFDPGLSPNAIAQHLRSGDFQFAILSSSEFCMVDEPAGLEVIAAGLYDNGKTSQKGLIVAKNDSPLKTLADCKGKRFAFGPAKDLLYDYASRKALQYGGVSEKDLVRELLPPYTLTGRINLASGTKVAEVVAFDATIPAGVIDETTFNALPEKNGSFLTGPSRDMFRTIGVTDTVPGMVVLAGPKSDPVMVQKMKAFMIGKVKSDENICKQMKVSGFTEPDQTALAMARQLVAKP